MDYKGKAEEVSKKVLSYIQEDASGWKVVKSTKHVSVLSKPSEEFSGTLYRAEARIEVPAKNLFPFLYVPEYHEKWDKSVKSYKIVETIDEVIQDCDGLVFKTLNLTPGSAGQQFETRVVHDGVTSSLYTRSCQPSSSKGGNCKNSYHFDGKAVSVEHPNHSPSSTYIRGTSFPSGYACCPHPENPSHTKFIAILQVDLGGMLMPSLIDSVIPTTLVNLITDCKSGIKSLKGKLP